jgi:hypothetical protein
MGHLYQSPNQEGSHSVPFLSEFATQDFRLPVSVVQQKIQEIVRLQEARQDLREGGPGGADKRTKSEDGDSDLSSIETTNRERPIKSPHITRLSSCHGNG